jgi:hypothetical protein
MAAVVAEIKQREADVKQILVCLRRLSELERLLWYPRLLAEIQEEADSSVLASVQPILIAVQRDLAALRPTGHS